MILSVYRFNPAWPAPAGRTRHQHSHSDGSTYWVETDGAAPTNSDVSAVLTPAPTAAQLREQTFVADTDRQDIISRLQTATPDQIKAYVQSNVTDLASAKTLLARTLLALSIVVKA
jgi:hypothetical protein